MANVIMVIAGASGVIGRHLVNAALEKGYKIRILSRGKHADSDQIRWFHWDPEDSAGSQAADALEGADILVNLAGRPLSAGRLGAAARKEILASRIQSTRALIQAWTASRNPPHTWIQASAIGYYGNTGQEMVDEKNPPGDFFLSRVCEEWEKEILNFHLQAKDLTLIITRFGMVLAKDAKAWQRLIQPVRLGLGGPIGTGQQWYSWIDADDAARAMLFLFENHRISATYNFTAPESVRQIDFVKKVARILHRPCFMPVPGFFLRLLFGTTADELLLASCRAIPARLLAAGYQFQKKNIDDELLSLLIPRKNPMEGWPE